MIGKRHLTDLSEGSKGIWYKTCRDYSMESIPVTCTGKKTGEWVYVIANGKTTRVKMHNLFEPEK